MVNIQNPLICTEKEYLDQHGASMCDLGDSGIHRTGNISKRKQNAIMRIQAKKSLDWQKKRDQLRQEYREKVSEGIIRPPTRLERLKQIAQGHPDREDVKAAKRLLKKYHVL